MRELSLFTGAGGGLLASKLLGFKSIGYVEFNDYCQRVIKQRISDGMLDNAPIFGDIRTFISEGYAASYTGMVDVLTGGFPCQPFSCAGRRRGVSDERNMWPETAIVVSITKPRLIMFENVPGILSYLPMVIRDLRRLGYVIMRPIILGGGSLNYPIKRNRIWILGFNNKEYFDRVKEIYQRANIKKYVRSAEPSCHISDIETSWLVSNGYASTEPYGMASELDEIEAIGNGQIPAVAAAAWRILINGG